MDIIEYVDSIKIIFREFQSLIDKYVFDFGKCVASRDYYTMELCVKRFKNHVNSFVKEMEWKLEKFEIDINGIDVLKKLIKYEREISNLNDCVNFIKEDYELLQNENSAIRKENTVLKSRIKDLEISNDKKENEIYQLQQNFQNLKIAKENQSKEISKNSKHITEEKEFLNEILQLKENEHKKLQKEYKEKEKELRKIKEEALVSSILIKQYEETIAEYKSQIERCKHLEKVDHKNLINTKVLLNNANEQLINQEDQLHIDFDLITKLKDEVLTLKHYLEEKKQISLDLEDERRTNLIIYKDMEGLKIQFDTINRELTAVGEKNVKLKLKKSALIIELQKLKNEIIELQNRNDEISKNLAKLELDHSSTKLKLENIIKLNTNQRKEINFLNTVKTVADDKIKLLTAFIDDFRIMEHDCHLKLISENNSVRSRMDVMKRAYENLF